MITDNNNLTIYCELIEVIYLNIIFFHYIKYFLASCVTMPKRCLIYISGDYRPAQRVQNRAVIPLEQNKIFYRGYKG